MADLSFSARRLGKYLAVEVACGSTNVDLGVLATKDVLEILSQVDDFRYNLVSFLKDRLGQDWRQRAAVEETS